ncbi:MAG: M20/M25/M40 family metallo-hydrolase [Ignavibacteriales bacterium]|nr:M20/M25/M40 family metallo-hydrolase [Ignavibacteriales bacterium]
MNKLLVFLFFSGCLLSTKSPGQPREIQRALDFIKSTELQTLDEQVKICEISAPPFNEEKRAAYFKKRFLELGLKNVRIDKVGNVIGERPGASQKPTIVLSAHLDTVFPQGTDVRVIRTDSTLKAPGIGDDSRGLAAMLAVTRALNEAKIRTEGTLIFVATVGEEGLGDLRGVRHLFDLELKDRVTHFVSIDGSDNNYTDRAVGSNRYRVTFKGPGGHSYGAFGLTNPIHALGRAIEKISRLKVPTQPKTTFNVGRIEGGTSVNSIAHTARFEMDIRSESPVELAKLDSMFQAAVQQGLNEENEFWSSRRKLTADVELIGRRPTGSLGQDNPMLKAVLSADSLLGITSESRSGSTDSNVPISLGIPAITIPGGGYGEGAHSLDEIFYTKTSYLGPQRALLAVLAIVGVSK